MLPSVCAAMNSCMKAFRPLAVGRDVVNGRISWITPSFGSGTTHFMSLLGVASLLAIVAGAMAESTTTPSTMPIVMITFDPE